LYAPYSAAARGTLITFRPAALSFNFDFRDELLRIILSADVKWVPMDYQIPSDEAVVGQRYTLTKRSGRRLLSRYVCMSILIWNTQFDAICAFHSRG
jgi:hypothetical protein